MSSTTGTDAGLALASRVELVRTSIAAACTRVGRAPDSVTLIAVSKMHAADVVLGAVACGLTHFGENRVEEAASKIPEVHAGLPGSSADAARLTWHMIGHVQSRKAREVVGLFDWLHSLDSSKLAERCARFVDELGRDTPLRALLEINISGEASKGGLPAFNWQHDRTVRAALWEEVRRCVAQPELHVSGLMTMAPVVDHAEQTRPVFASLRSLRDAFAADFPSASWSALSMGMTDDYEIAIEEGATMVRIGRAIFGPRDTDT